MPWLFASTEAREGTPQPRGSDAVTAPGRIQPKDGVLVVAAPRPWSWGRLSSPSYTFTRATGSRQVRSSPR